MAREYAQQVDEGMLAAEGLFAIDPEAAQELLNNRTRGTNTEAPATTSQSTNTVPPPAWDRGTNTPAPPRGPRTASQGTNTDPPPRGPRTASQGTNTDPLPAGPQTTSQGTNTDPLEPPAAPQTTSQGTNTPYDERLEAAQRGDPGAIIDLIIAGRPQPYRRERGIQNTAWRAVRRVQGRRQPQSLADMYDEVVDLRPQAADERRSRWGEPQAQPASAGADRNTFDEVVDLRPQLAQAAEERRSRWGEPQAQPASAGADRNRFDEVVDLRPMAVRLQPYVREAQAAARSMLQDMNIDNFVEGIASRVNSFVDDLANQIG
jgi:hypothetical protein